MISCKATAPQYKKSNAIKIDRRTVWDDLTSLKLLKVGVLEISVTYTVDGGAYLRGSGIKLLCYGGLDI